jgi:hypothetical protein
VPPRDYREIGHSSDFAVILVQPKRPLTAFFEVLPHDEFRSSPREGNLSHEASHQANAASIALSGAGEIIRIGQRKIESRPGIAN